MLGILQALHARARTEGSFELIDGERRWRAAKTAGLLQVPCEVWPADTNPRDVLVAGVVLNHQRKAHSCIQIARRLQEIKATDRLTSEDLAARVGIPLDRIKTYSALLCASDTLQSFLQKHEVPIKVAAEMMRYEKATDPAKGRKLIERYLRAPMNREEIVALRRRAEKRGHGPTDAPSSLTRKPLVTDRFQIHI